MQEGDEMPKSDQHIEVPGSVRIGERMKLNINRQKRVEAKYTGIRGMVGPGVAGEQVNRS